MIVDGIVEPMELGHLPYKRRTFEHYVGVRGYDRLGKKQWRKEVAMPYPVSLPLWNPRRWLWEEETPRD